ncbi:MAG: S8 family serine peptidase, partial [Solirubrobacterales bacterium]
GVTARRSLAAPGLQQVRVPEGQSLNAAAAELRANADVEFVQLPGMFHKLAPVFPNDPYFVEQYQWSLHNTGQVFACAGPCSPTTEIAGTADADVDAPEAWEIWPGPAAGWSTYAGPRETIAIVDTGVAWQHQDLADNIWTNPAESGANATNGIDDDPYVGGDAQPRAYIDDVRGWDFIGDRVEMGVPDVPNGNCATLPDLDPCDIRQSPDNDPRDAEGHGTHVAGIAAAVGNDLTGVTGTNPLGRIMPLRAGDENGDFTFGAIEEAFSYAIDHGARVVNGSFGGPSNPPGMGAIIDANPDVLFVFAAGNSGQNHGSSGGENYPCDIPADNVICVAATNEDDVLASYSDYGRESVDVAAPGSVLLSTKPAADEVGGGESDYKYSSGTSMASPVVAAAASAVWSANPTLDSSQVKTVIVSNLDAKSSLGQTVGFGGRLNLYKAVSAAATPPPTGWPETPPPPTELGNPPTPTPLPAPLPVEPLPDLVAPSLKVVNPGKARVGRTGVIRFSVICGEDCSLNATSRARVSRAVSISSRLSAMAGIRRTIKLAIPRKRLLAVRSALRRGRKVYLSVAVYAVDKSGNRTTTRRFKIRLLR